MIFASVDSPRSRALAAGALATIVVVVAGSSFAQPGATDEARVVARVGDEAITAASLEARMAKMPPYQLARLGETGPEIARKVLDQMAGSLAITQAARADGVAEMPAQRDRIRSILASALLNEIRETAAAEAVTDDDVKAFYFQNRERYASQRRLRIFQITVASRDEAEAILETIRSDPKFREDPVARWDALARERSIDKTTNMRGGDLGFVQPDGSTRHRDVNVPAAIYEAALKVEDGEVVPEPLKVGEHWLVVQRRGTVETPERTLEAETPTIRALLGRKKLEELTRELVEKLRKEHLKEVHPELVERIAVDAEGDIAPMPRPNALRQSHEAAAPPGPEGKPGNLR